MTLQDYEHLFSGFSFNNVNLSDDITFTQVSGRTHIDVIDVSNSASTVYMSDYMGYPNDICDPMFDIIEDSEFAGQDTDRVFNLYFMNGEDKKHLQSFWFEADGSLVFYPIVP